MQYSVLVKHSICSTITISVALQHLVRKLQKTSIYIFIYLSRVLHLFRQYSIFYSHVMISLSLWSLFLCHCFDNVSKFMSFQRFYEIHQNCDLDCSWTLQARKVFETQMNYVRQVIEQNRLAKQQQQIERTRLVKKRQKVEQVRAYKTYLTRQEQWERDEQARLLKKQQQIDKKVEKTRIAKKQKEVRLIVFACKRCSAKYFNNIKLHEHIRDHHAKKSKSVSNSSTFSISFSISSQSILFLFENSKSASQSKILSISFTSSQSIFFSVDNLKSASQSKTLLFISFFSFSQSIIVSSNFSSKFSSFISSKRSFLSNSASEFVFKRSENASSISFQKLAAMRSTFFFKSIFKIFSKKSYLIIENFHRMFVEKNMKSKLFAIQNSFFFSNIFVSRQARIIVYFLFIFSVSKSTKFEIFTSMYDSIKQSIRASFSRFFSSRSFFYFFSIRFLFSTISYFFFVCWRCQELFVICLFRNWTSFILAKVEIFMKRRERRLFV